MQNDQEQGCHIEHEECSKCGEQTYYEYVCVCPAGKKMCAVPGGWDTRKTHKCVSEQCRLVVSRCPDCEEVQYSHFECHCGTCRPVAPFNCPKPHQCGRAAKAHEPAPAKATQQQQTSENMMDEFTAGNDEIGIFDLSDYVLEFVPYTAANAIAVKSLNKMWRFIAFMAGHWEGPLRCHRGCHMLLNPTKLQKSGFDKHSWCMEQNTVGDIVGSWCPTPDCTCNVVTGFKDAEEEERDRAQVGGFPAYDWLAIDLAVAHNFAHNYAMRGAVASQPTVLRRVYFDSWPQDSVVAARLQMRTGVTEDQAVNDDILCRFGPRNLRYFCAANAPVSAAAVQLCPKLKFLDLRNAQDYASGHAFRVALQHLPKLTHFAFTQSKEFTKNYVSQEDLMLLRAHPTLTWFTLAIHCYGRGHVSLTNAVIENAITTIPNLRHLSLDVMIEEFTDKTINAFATNCKKLETLVLNYAYYSMGMFGIPKASNVHALAAALQPTLRNFKMIPKGTSASFSDILKQLPDAQRLCLPKSDLRDDEAAEFKNLTSLRSLDLSCYRGLTHLSFLSGLKSNLRALILQSCDEQSGDFFADLQCLEQLHTLDLTCCKAMTDKDLGSALSGAGFCKTLKRLDLHNCVKVTRAGLVHLHELSALEELILWGVGGVDDASLQYISGLSELRILDLTECTNVTDKGLAHLRSWRKLELLGLAQIPNITAAGVISCVERMNQLRYLDLCASAAGSADDVMAIKKRFPSTLLVAMVERPSRERKGITEKESLFF